MSFLQKAIERNKQREQTPPQPKPKPKPKPRTKSKQQPPQKPDEQEVTLLKRLLLLYLEYQQFDYVQETRMIDLGRALQDLNVLLTLQKKEIAQQLVGDGELEKGTRGGFSLP